MLSGLGYRNKFKTKYGTMDTSNKLLEINNDEMELKPIADFNKSSPETKSEIKKNLSQLSNQTKQINKEKQEAIDNELFKIKYQLWDCLNNKLDDIFPTCESLKIYAENSGKTSYCLVDCSYSKIANPDKLIYILLLCGDYYNCRHCLVKIRLMNHDFHISVKKSFQNGNQTFI